MPRPTLLLATTLAFAVPLVGAPLEGVPVIGGSVAHAETAEARQAGDVFAAPGEQSRVVARIRAGAMMTVLSRSGRWLKVRVNGRTGWVPRSVVVADVKEDTRRTRKRPFVEGRSVRRGSRGSAPRDRIGADVVEGEEGFIDPDAKRAPRAPDRDARGSIEKRERSRAREEVEPTAEESDAVDEADDDAVVVDDADDVVGDAGAGDGDGDENGEPRAPTRVVVVSSQAGLFAEPSRRAASVGELREGTWATVLEREEGWVHLKSASGMEGWVRADDVDDQPYHVHPRRAWRLGAGLGFASLSQAFTSDSAQPLGNYKIASNALAVALGGDIVFDYSKSLLIGGDVAYRYGHATPGIRCTPERCGGEDAVDIGFKTHDLDLGASLGYKLMRSTGMAAFARLGYHYGMTKIDKVDDAAANPARLPTEALSGVTIGAHVDVPQMWPRWAFHAGVDALVLLAKRVQTRGLEDGDVSDAFALWAGARGAYAWKDKLKATAELSYGYAKTKWTGQAEESLRAHQASSAVRSDRTVMLLLGLTRPF
jgi:SH3-like domain-containing protein